MASSTAVEDAPAAGASPGGGGVEVAGRARAIGDPGTPFGWGRPAQPSHWPDLAVHAADLDGVSIRAASARGRMHRYLGTPRQDACGVSWDEGTQRLIATVCDGVGSLERSHEAADLVTRLTPAIVQAADGDWPVAFEALSTELTIGPGVELARDARTIWATTVCIADVRSSRPASRVDRTDGTNGTVGAREAHVAAVGDSTAWLLRDGRWAHVCGSLKADRDDEAPASTLTAALPASAITLTTAVVGLRPGDALFLMSDGVGDALGHGGGEVGDALAHWWAEPPAPHEFAAQVQFERRGFQDDRTVVGIWIGAGAATSREASGSEESE